MTKQIAGLLMLLLLALTASAQMAMVKGSVKDESGQPIVGADVEFLNTENGRKFTLKTDKKGEFYSIAIPSGTRYKLTLSKDGKVLLTYDRVPVTLAQENVFNLDLAKERAMAQQKQQQGMTEEQRKELERIQKENEKIKGLNERLAQADMASKTGNHEQAVAILTEAVAIDPTRDLIWFRLAEAQRAARKFADAVPNYEKAIALKSQQPPDTNTPRLLGGYYNNLGEAYAKAGQTEKAIDSYNRAAQVDASQAGMYYFNMGAVLTNTNKTDEAVAAFDKAVAADPTRADAYYWKGVALLGKATVKDGKMIAPEGTEEAFNKYLELQPEGPFAQPAKDMLASIGAEVRTQYGKRRSKK